MGKIIEKNNEYSPIIAIPPGETILESIEAINMTQAELAARLGITTKHINNIIKGNAPITYDMALKLEDVIGPSAKFWMNLETNYQLDKARIEKEQELSVDLEILKDIPYNDMAKLGWVEKTKDKLDRVRNTRKLYKVANLAAIKTSYAVAFRLNKVKNEISDYSVLAWLAKAENKGEKIDVCPLNRVKLKKMIPTFRKLTLEPPEVFYPKMKELCSECGIALVLVESLPKTYICGATIWKGEKAILALSVRGKKADIFWFTFFHEIAHLIEHTKKDFHINYEKGGDKEECEADDLARNYLIPDDLYNDFIENYNYKNSVIISQYAKEISIAPCILVGRLQHDNLLQYNYEYEKLRPSFQIVKK